MCGGGGGGEGVVYKIIITIYMCCYDPAEVEL